MFGKNEGQNIEECSEVKLQTAYSTHHQEVMTLAMHVTRSQDGVVSTSMPSQPPLQLVSSLVGNPYM